MRHRNATATVGDSADDTLVAPAVGNSLMIGKRYQATVADVHDNDMGLPVAGGPMRHLRSKPV